MMEIMNDLPDSVLSFAASGRVAAEEVRVFSVDELAQAKDWVAG